MRIARLRAAGAPVTRASPIVIMTASTFPALKASIDGVYSNHESSVSTPASLNQPFRIPISKAVHPGQSLNAILRGGFAGAVGVADAAGAPPAAGVSFLSQLVVASQNRQTDANTIERRGVCFMSRTLAGRL